MPDTSCKSLDELSQSADELIESCGDNITTFQKALDFASECIDDYKRNLSLKEYSNSKELYESSFIYFTAAKKILNDIIPKLNQYQYSTVYQKELYRKFQTFLQLESDSFTEIKNHLNNNSDTKKDNDLLRQKFNQLLNSPTSERNTATLAQPLNINDNNNKPLKTLNLNSIPLVNTLSQSKLLIPSNPLIQPKSNILSPGFKPISTPIQLDSNMSPIIPHVPLNSDAKGNFLGPNIPSLQLSPITPGLSPNKSPLQPSPTLSPVINSLNLLPINPLNTNKNDVIFNKFSNQGYVTDDDLTHLLESFPDDILIIDLRSKKYFDMDHITLTDNVIQLEPVSIRENYTTEDIYHYSMITNTDIEKQLFKDISKFELIIIIDPSSNLAKKSVELNRLFAILDFKNYIWKLKRRPVILEGGFNEWLRFKQNIKSPIDSRPFFSATRKHYTNHCDHKSLMANNFGSSYEDYNHKPVISSKPIPIQFRPTPFSSSPISRSPSPTKTNLIPNMNFNHSIRKPKPVCFSNNSPPVLNNNNMRPKIPMIIPQQSSNNNLNINSIMLKLNSNLTTNIVTGLLNLGNSCYMNSGLQCLIGTKALVEFLFNKNYKQFINTDSILGSKGILTNEFALLACEMSTNSSSSKPTFVNPLRFRRCLASLNLNFRNADQQDCSEFLNYLLDTLHEDLNINGNHPKLSPLSSTEEENRESMPIRIASTIEWERYIKTNFSTIVDIFNGQILSRLECQICHKTSTTYNPFSTLSLPLPSPSTCKNVTLLSCFDEFVKEELLTGDDSWFCPNCKKRQHTLKTLKISRLPRVLVVHLKRFAYNHALFSKDGRFVDYPLTINLDKYWPKPTSNLEFEELCKLPSRGQIGPWNYKLNGVVQHLGTLAGGHYTSIVRKNEGWWFFDDEKCTKFRESNVVNGNGYVFFYERV